MTSRQRLRRAFWRLGESDRPPFAPLMPDYWTNSLPGDLSGKRSPEGPSTDDGRGDDFQGGGGGANASHLELSKMMGGDAFIRIPAFTSRLDDTIHIKKTVEGDFTRIRYSTPLGEVEEVLENAPLAETIFKMEFAVKEEADFEVLEYLFDHTIYGDNCGEVTKAIEETGEEGLVGGAGLGAPLVRLFRFREPAKLLLDSYDRPDVIKRAADAIHRSHLRAYEIIKKSPAEVIIAYCADLSASLISPAMFERYALPYLREYAEILHCEGKLLIVHLCGHLEALLPLLKQTGIDGICSLTLPPMGDTTIDMVRDVLGDDFPVIGGLDPVLFALQTPDRVRSHVEATLEGLSHTRGLILAPSDSTPAGTTMENLTEAARTIAEWFSKDAPATQ